MRARRRPTSAELAARPWFVVIEDVGIVEIIDGPFDRERDADIAAARHEADGEHDVRVMQRFAPRRLTHWPLFGPAYDDA